MPTSHIHSFLASNFEFAQSGVTSFLYFITESKNADITAAFGRRKTCRWKMVHYQAFQIWIPIWLTSDTWDWNYPRLAQKTCSGDYAFTFLSDRYMDSREVTRVAYTSSLEDCLSACLDESNFACRSVSFNRTDGGCHLSQQNQLSKPALLRMNNNPNFRIDYYESNCFNSKFSSFFFSNSPPLWL